ncbi:MAG: glycosyltransferase family 39 protein [DPANN group archaeon]|nr:glycosyltransferase family 39 protein [DPANN group archaeon]
MKQYNDDKKKLILLIIITIILYIILYPQHSFYPDTYDYLFAGESILSLDYPYSIIHRGPIIPFFISILLALNIKMLTIMFIIPLIFSIFAVIAVFFLGKTLIKDGFTPSIILLTIPYFWRYSTRLIVDIPLLAFSSIALLYFFKTVEIKESYFYKTCIFTLVSILTKITGFILIPIYFLYALTQKKISMFTKKSMIIPIIITIILFLTIITTMWILSGSTGMDYLNGFSTVSKTHTISILFYMIRLTIIPWSLFFIIGIYQTLKEKKKEQTYLLISFLTILFAFTSLGWKEVRFIAPLFGIYAIIATIGYNKIKIITPKISKILFILLMMFTSLETIAISTLDNNTHWGIDILANEIQTFDNNTIIQSEYMPDMLKMITGYNVIPILTNNTDQKVNTDYIILSIYSEFEREPIGAYDYPKILGKDIKLIKLKNTSIRPPKDYTFNSKYYHNINNKYQKISEIKNKNQTVFIIYRQ